MKKLYPVYIVLFSNDTPIGHVIQKFTKQPYTHAAISLDPSLNNMYSFSGIPLSNVGLFSSAGFVRESLWSPQYSTNRYFTVLVTFTDKEGIKTINKHIEIFKSNYHKLKYNTLGLIEYYLNFKERKTYDINLKKKWFCSEFVSYMLKQANIKGFDNIMISPSDIVDKGSSIIIGDYTIKTFDENDLIKKTNKALIEFKKQQVIESEMFIDNNQYDIVTENSIKNLVKSFKVDSIDYRLTQYTALLDWKLLYIEYVTLFKYSAPELRFKLIEVIIKKGLIPNKRPAYKATELIIEEMRKIHNHLRGRVINYIETQPGELWVIINNVSNKFCYPKDFNSKEG